MGNDNRSRGDVIGALIVFALVVLCVGGILWVQAGKH